MRDCARFDALIARSAQLTAEQAAELEAHLASCGSCRSLVGAVRPIDVALAATGAADTMPTLDETANARRVDRGLPDATTDRYRITGEVGRGGIGRVVRALDQVLDRPVALKELFSATDGTRRRFVREALITARLQHPSIVPVYDAGHLGDRSPFYAMKLVAGRPLDKAIGEARTLAQRLALLPSVLAVADAIAYAHNERIIHRDLKPMNVLVGKYGETIVIDWGLAKDLGVDDLDALDAGPYRATNLEQTVAGAVLGTPAYMAPEQAAGEAVDERADVYALGAILYHVVSGAIPHEGNTLDEMVQRVVSGDVRPLAEREPDVPRDLAAIVTKAMAVDPSARYPNAQGFADDLRRFQNGQLVASHSYGARELLRRWLKRHRAAVMVALVALGILCFVATTSVMQIVHAKHEADEAAAIANKERNSATRALADMLQEQGRQELLAGHPARAAVYLSEAQTQNHDGSVALRSLLADAMRSLEAQRLSLEGHTTGLAAARFSPDGTRIVTVSEDAAKIWDAATGKVVATLNGDNLRIRSVSFSPDGARIVTASSDRKAKLWDARTGELLGAFEHDDWLRTATFSPDGTRVVTTGKRSVVELWDAKTTKLLGLLEGHRGRVSSAAFSADGTRVVTASADATAKIWDAKTARLVVSLDGHHKSVASATFSPDGTQVATASADGTAKLWDARTGKLVASLDGHTAEVESVAFSPDGSRVVTAGHDHTAKIWDSRTGKLVASLDGHGAWLHSAVFSPDGSRVVTASYDHTARLWDGHTGRLLASFEGHRDDVSSASFSPDGTQVLTASEDGLAKLWDAKPSKLQLSIDSGAGHVTDGELGPDSAMLVTIAEGDRTAKIWDARSGKLVASLDGHHGDVSFAGFDAAGTRIVTASADHTAKVWEARTGKPIVSLDHPAEVHSARFSPDGARIVTAGADNGARLWNAKTGELIAKLDNPAHVWDDDDEHVHFAAFSTDSARLVTAGADGARLWRADSGKLIAELAKRTEVYSAAFSRDGERVVTAGDHTPDIWDARTGEMITSLEGHTDDVHSVSFSPDGSRVVSASSDHTAKLWDARTGELLASLEGHTGGVNGAVFSPDPDGARVVTTSTDRTAKIWDGRTGKLLASLDGHSDAVFDAVFSRDGARVMTASRDGTIKIWNVQLEERTPDAIHGIISDRDPWTLSNGGLVPVPGEAVASSHRDDEDDEAPDDGAAAPPAKGSAPAVTSNNDYTTQLVAMSMKMGDLFQETDCDKLAASIRSFLDANRAQMDALGAWQKAHAIDEAAVHKAMGPAIAKFSSSFSVYDKCQNNQAFAAAFAAARPHFRH